MTLNGTPHTIVGVLAQPFDADTAPSDGYFLSTDLFIPAAQFPAPRGLHAAGPVMLGIARLKDGVSVARATADLDVIYRRLAASGVQAGAANSSSFTAQAGRSLYAQP